MTTRAVLEVKKGSYNEIAHALLPPGSDCEEAVFGFAQTSVAGDVLVLELVEWISVPPDGFVSRSPYFLHLSDETRSRVIKRAHDLQLSVVEFHSHPLQREAEFSPSDWSGFDEFVPHIRWRLKNRPYAAFVFGAGTFDALAWDKGVDNPIGFERISWEGAEARPTGLSLRHGRTYNEFWTL